MKLTKENYYTRHRYLSNSKLSDFIRDKNYFYRKHIQGIVQDEKTDALLVGDAVDTYLTEGKEAFYKRFIKVERRNKKEPPIGFVELTAAQYELALGMAQKLELQPAFQDIIKEKFVAQKILQVELPIGSYFDGLCGKPDWFKVSKGGTCTIIDLKTTASIDIGKYEHSCSSYGYYRQQAFYQMLLKSIYQDDIKHFESRHIAVEKDPYGIYPVGVFIINQQKIEEEKLIINELINELIDEKNFDVVKRKWGDAKIIPWVYDKT